MARELGPDQFSTHSEGEIPSPQTELTDPRYIVQEVSSLKSQEKVQELKRSSLADGTLRRIIVNEAGMRVVQSSVFGKNFAWFGVMDGQPDPLFYLRAREGLFRHGEELKVGTFIDVKGEVDSQAIPGLTAVRLGSK